MKKLLSLLFMAGILVFAVSCGDDDSANVDEPTVTAPSGTTGVEAGAEATLTFSVEVPGGFKAATATATGGEATVTTSPEAGATTGDVVVTFTAGDEDGAASVTLTVTDNSDQSSNATALLNVSNEITVTANITANTTWRAGNVYILGGRIAVVDGVTLTIEPGTIVKGQTGAGANSTALIIARGGKLMAEGTAELPIIFTAVNDELSPEDVAAGNFGSPNLSSETNAQWGGLIVLGKARISASAAEVQIEGIPTSDTNGLYGGTDDEDNSGVLKYISIRHGGTEIGAGNEINGLTLGAVGSGTVIENIEVVSNLDDGIEWFGGTVNVKNVVVWNSDDDGIDTDQSWSGTLDNFVVIAAKGHAFELDGPEGTYSAGHVIQNGTIIASAEGRVTEDLINVDDNSIVDLKNLFFTGIQTGQKINRVTAAGVTFTAIELNVDAAALVNYVNGAVPAGVTAASTASAGVGADTSVFGWTWASQAGAF